MDFQSLKRRDLQALCKLNNIPANLTNAAMANALETLQAVKGIEDLLVQSETGALESSQKCVPNSPYVARTSTCQKPSKEGLECSTLSTRTRCGARRVPTEGTDTRKTTTATRTTRRRGTQEASIQLEMEKDMQAKFEEDLEQSDVTADSGIESTETSEEVSDISVDQREHIMSGSKNQPENNDGEVVDVCEDKQNVSIEMSNSLQKLDFHSLGRKDLQNLCKRNKIPANMTNAVMADALGSLDTVEGLEEFLEGYDPLAIKSPQTSRMTSSRVPQARTAQKTTGRKSARAGSVLCKSVARKMEDLNEQNQECPISMNTNEGGMSVEMDKNLQAHFDEGCLEKSEFVDYAPENISTTINSATKSVSEELASDNQTAVVLSEEFSNLLKNEVKLQDDASEKVSNDQEAKVTISSESNMAELKMTDSDCSSEPSADKCSMLEAPEAVINGFDECNDLNDKSGGTRTLESESETNFSYKPHCEGLMQDAPVVTIKGFAQLRELSDLEADNEDFEVLPDTENSKLYSEFANEIVSTEEDSDVSEGINSILHIDEDLKPEANCGTEDEHVESGFASTGISDDVATLCPVSEPEDDNAEHRVSVRFVSETATQDFQHVLKGKATPLCRKSLRKLKKLVKEKLQETNLLAKKMENLSLQDNEITVDVAKKVEENLREVTDETSDELNSSTVSVLCDIVEETNEGVEWKAKDVVESILTDSKICEEPIEPSSFPLTAINAPKPLVFTTPIKSSSKTPISICVLDANKENIHDSANKMTLTPVMSMGKLKKEVKVLLVQSEKKRPALQSRSDNQCSLTSP